MAEETATGTLGLRPSDEKSWAGQAPDDRDLLAQCRQGDMTAFSLLVEKYQDRLFNTTYRLCGNYQDACELTQETFLRALRGIAGFRGEAKFYTWLFRIALNLTRSHRRRAGRRRWHSLDQPDGTLELASQASRLGGNDCPDPAERAEQAERNSKVAAALDQLAQQYKTVIVLRDVEGLDYQQIARIVGVPVGTVKSRVHRGRLTLRKYLADLVE